MRCCYISFVAALKYWSEPIATDFESPGDAARLCFGH